MRSVSEPKNVDHPKAIPVRTLYIAAYGTFLCLKACATFVVLAIAILHEKKWLLKDVAFILTLKHVLSKGHMHIPCKLYIKYFLQ